MTATEKRAKSNAKYRRGYVNMFKEIATRTPRWGLVLLEIFEVGGILIFLAQLPVTYAAVRLEFELRWYLVTDRSLRIRSGLLSMQESTMSFANLQQVEVMQGPLQRWLGLADVRVQSAGGGGDHAEGGAGDSLHTGVFHGVENAGEIRDLILARLRLFRESGIGDPDDAPAPGAGTPVATDAGQPVSSAALAAAQELLAETRALRAALA
ncbi:MAG: PH domain-containing protein [Opitutae bacterium]|nr:PH domain-containing protein [Opitutae bacterium]